ncbi:MAG: CPBP family intramembrane metalloprotease [Verrucomicrobiaceae bacterium]|nr:CPBP family intramembrane metalloprotease [Verrucomicrobiaceae bacterium]
MSLSLSGQRAKLSRWLPSLIAGWCLLAFLYVQHQQDLKSSLPDALAVHASRTMWCAEAEGSTAAETDEIRILRAAYERFDGTKDLELAVLVRWLGDQESDPDKKQRLMAEARSLVTNLRWPVSATAHAPFAVRLLKDEKLSAKEANDLSALRKEWPRSWSIMHLTRLANLEVNDVSPSAESVSQSAMQHASWLIRLEIGIAVAALVYLLAAARGRGTVVAPKTRAGTAVPKLWRPERVILCIFLTMVVLFLTNHLLAVAAMSYSFYSQLIVYSLGGAALQLCFPLLWILHSFVRKRRWYWSAIQLNWRDFQSGHLILQSFGIAALAFTIQTAFMLLLSKAGGTIDLLDSLSRSFWAWGEWSLLLHLFWGCLVAPVSEEIMFRGFLYPAFKNTLSPIWAAAASSAVFALIHGYSAWGFVMIWGIGVLLCLVYERTNRLALAIMVHSWVNLLIAPFDWLWMRP